MDAQNPAPWGSEDYSAFGAPAHGQGHPPTLSQPGDDWSFNPYEGQPAHPPAPEQRGTQNVQDARYSRPENSVNTYTTPVRPSNSQAHAHSTGDRHVPHSAPANFGRVRLPSFGAFDIAATPQGRFLQQATPVRAHHGYTNRDVWPGAAYHDHEQRAYSKQSDQSAPSHSEPATPFQQQQAGTRPDAQHHISSSERVRGAPPFMPPPFIPPVGTPPGSQPAPELPHPPSAEHRIERSETISQRDADKENDKAPANTGARKPNKYDNCKELSRVCDDLFLGKKKGKPAVKGGAGTKSTAAKGGKGSRSGVNRRGAGGSDDEVAELGAEAIEEIKNTTKGRELWKLEDKKLAISYICSNDVWPDFKVNRAKECIQISQVILDSRKTVKQVGNMWDTAYELYKAVVRRNEHTGGGDGDEGDEGGDGGKKDKPKTKKDSRGPSHKQMDVFEESGLFDIIDTAACNNEEVVRKRVYGASRDVSDDDNSAPKSKRRRRGGDEDDDDMMRNVLSTINTKHDERDAVAKETLQLAKRKEEREQLMFASQEQRWQRELELAEGRHQLENLAERRKNRVTLWDRAQKMSESQHAVVRQKGEELLARLVEEEEKDGFN